jgi:hypothetical protein
MMSLPVYDVTDDGTPPVYDGTSILRHQRNVTSSYGDADDGTSYLCRHQYPYHSVSILQFACHQFPVSKHPHLICWICHLFPNNNPTPCRPSSFQNFLNYLVNLMHCSNYNLERFQKEKRAVIYISRTISGINIFS